MIDETRQQNQAVAAVETSGSRELIPAPRASGPPARQDTAPTGPGGERSPAWRLMVALAVLLLVAGSAGSGWYWWQQRQRNALPAGITSANGRIEAEPVDVATRYAGRLDAVLVDEGAMVRAGQVVARMDIRELEAALRQAEAQERQAQRSLEARRAAVMQQRSQFALAQTELERARTLLRSGSGTRQVFDQRQATRDGAEAALDAADAQVAEVEQAVQAAREAAERIRTQIVDSTLIAPIDGRVQYRLAHTGEVLAAGGRVVTLLDVTYVYMTVFLPTEQAGRLPLGTEARIVLDAVPDYVIPATVTFVSPQAQFTPKQVETRSERDRLMFRVKLRINADLLRRYAERVRTGLPGVGYVQLNPDVAWPDWLQPGRRAAEARR